MNFIKRLRVANSSHTVDLNLHTCGFRDMQTWHQLIHKPFIEPSGDIGSDWDWRARFIGCNLSEALFRRKALTFQFRVASRDGLAIPVAQFILSVPYRWPANPTDGCAFIWLLARTPKAALAHYGVDDWPVVLPAVLDTAIQVSLESELQGRIGLHASAGGSQKQNEELERKYIAYGLQRREKLGGYFAFPHRREDGRFFYFGPAEAQAFSITHDDLR